MPEVRLQDEIGTTLGREDDYRDVIGRVWNGDRERQGVKAEEHTNDNVHGWIVCRERTGVRSNDAKDVCRKLLEIMFPTISPVYIHVNVLHFRYLPAWTQVRTICMEHKSFPPYIAVISYPINPLNWQKAYQLRVLVQVHYWH